ncbi:hypothetical protein D6C87_01950 [Aureobasidium pullulans]|uniref:RNA helicase n=1 Tax=Aureobasidium pullulans TaxID=5580 RepID=A0AB38LWW3_AURPU|nr:hypothetical protein D6C94_05148 [Aureobasidium pullulans]THZ46721.1 hypothetical protein D6C87_01950 [Aureobasidium pullulans]
MGITESKYCRRSVEPASKKQSLALGEQTAPEISPETLPNLTDSDHLAVHGESNGSSEHFASAPASADDKSSAPPARSQQNYFATAVAFAPSRAKISGLVTRLIEQYGDAVEVPDLTLEAEERRVRPKTASPDRSKLLPTNLPIKSDNVVTAPVRSIPASIEPPTLFKPRSATIIASNTSTASSSIQEDTSSTPDSKQPNSVTSPVPSTTSLPVPAEHHDELQTRHEPLSPEPAVLGVSSPTLPDVLISSTSSTTHNDDSSRQLTTTVSSVAPVPRWIRCHIRASPPPSPDLTSLSYLVLAKKRDNAAALLAPGLPYGSLIKIPTTKKLALRTPPKLVTNLAARGIVELTTVQKILNDCAFRRVSAVIFGASIGKSSGAAIAAIATAWRSSQEHEEHRKDHFERRIACPTVVIVTSTGELVKKIIKTTESFLNESDDKSSPVPFDVFSAKGGDSKIRSVLLTSKPNILVCTLGRLAELTGDSNFSARLLHLLVIDQGAVLASAENQTNMDRIIAWARCEMSGPIRRALTFPLGPCPLTTIVLSHRIDFNLELHRQLRKRYLEFVGSCRPMHIAFARNPRVNFTGQIKVQTCNFNTTALCEYFVKKLLPSHPGERIICIDPSKERVVEESAKCNSLGIQSEAFTTEPERRQIIERFRLKKCKIMFTTPAAVEGIRYTDVKTLVIFASPYESFYTEQDGMDKPGVFKRREDCLRDYVEAIGPAGKEAIVYIFVAVGTDQKIKDAIAQVKLDAGLEVDAVLKPRSVCPNYYL